MISGYKIIDFRGTDLALSDNAYVVKGIYAAVTENYGKTTVVSNVKITGKKIDNIPVLFTSNSDGSLTGMVTIEVAADENTKTGVYLTIKPDDTVVYHTANFNGGGGVTPKKYTVKLIAGDQERTTTLYDKYSIFRIGYDNFQSEGTYYTDVSVQGDYGEGNAATMQMNINLTSAEAYIPFNKVTFARAGEILLEKDISVGGVFIGLERVNLDPNIDDGKIITITFTNV